MDLERLDKIKKLVIIAMFSDDELMELLVLKGGNAIDLIHGVAMRGSIDLDFSMESDFPSADVEALRARFEALLNTTLNPEGYRAFDVHFESRPSEVSAELQTFWGGYRLEFKVIAIDKFDALKGDPRRLRVESESFAPGHRKKLHVEISRHEYCKPKDERNLEGYTIYVYTPEMIVCEKLRAICQQMPEYGRIVRSRTVSARARDFFDVRTLIKHFGIDLSSAPNRELLTCMFEAKRVPLRLLTQIEHYREFHRPDFASV